MFQNEIDLLLEASFTREIRDYVLNSVAELKNEILIFEKEKISSESKDIQANLLKRIKILENDFKRSQAQSIDFELKLQHQKEKMTCDVSWKTKLIKLSDENVLLINQVDSVVQERENIKLEYQKLFNSIKATRVQHQHLLMTISELKNKIKTIEKGKNVNTKFDKSETLGKLLYVTPLNKNTSIKAKKVSNTEVKVDRSKPVTSHSTPKNEQSQKQRVESSNSVKRRKSKDTKSKNRVLKNTKVKSPSINARDDIKQRHFYSIIYPINYGVLGEDYLNGTHYGAKMKKSKETVLTDYSLYPSRKIRVFLPALHKKPRRTKTYTSYPGAILRRLQDLLYTKILEDIEHGPYSKNSLYVVLTLTNTAYRPYSRHYK
ncbi:hypothetical protein Tco_1258372 [Tanacetum coccineum]